MVWGECKGEKVKERLKADVCWTWGSVGVLVVFLVKIEGVDSWYCFFLWIFDFRSAMNSCFFTGKQVVHLFFLVSTMHFINTSLLLFESGLLGMENLLMRSCS